MSLWLTDLKNLHKRIVEIGKIDDSWERKIIFALQEKVHIWLHAGTRRKHFFRTWAFVMFILLYTLAYFNISGGHSPLLNQIYAPMTQKSREIYKKEKWTLRGGIEIVLVRKLTYKPLVWWRDFVTWVIFNLPQSAFWPASWALIHIKPKIWPRQTAR